MMKLGASYNVFDGAELLPSAISSIRNSVDFVSIVLQRVSNAGLKCSEETLDICYDLKRQKIIDVIYEYNTPPNKTRHEHEKSKRDIGLSLSKQNKCSHFMSLDVDEYYLENQIAAVKQFIEQNDLSATAVSIIEYLKSPRYQIINGYTFTNTTKGLYNFYCPFIFKIEKNFEQKHGYNEFPCLVDPTRSLPYKGKFYLFPMQQIVMHHMSTVRKNLYEKYTNSSLITESTTLNNHIIDLQNSILQFDFDKNLIFDNYSIFQDKIIKKVDNIFNIPEDFTYTQQYKHSLKKDLSSIEEDLNVNSFILKKMIKAYIKKKWHKLFKKR